MSHQKYLIIKKIVLSQKMKKKIKKMFQRPLLLKKKQSKKASPKLFAAVNENNKPENDVFMNIIKFS